MTKRRIEVKLLVGAEGMGLWDPAELVQKPVEGLGPRREGEVAGVLQDLGEAVKQAPGGAGLELLISLLEAVDLNVDIDLHSPISNRPPPSWCDRNRG
jgi:hypothetical protein